MSASSRARPPAVAGDAFPSIPPIPPLPELPAIRPAWTLPVAGDASPAPSTDDDAPTPAPFGQLGELEAEFARNRRAMRARRLYANNVLRSAP